MALTERQIAALEAEGVNRAVIERALARLAAGAAEGWQRRLQGRLGVAQDGIVGPATLGALFRRTASAGVAEDRIGGLASAAARHFGPFGILDRPERLTEWVGECGHETMGWRHLREIWGPTPAQRRYEGRRDLGNSQPGDGRRFLGRGCIHLTGRANYARAARETGLPLLDQPELLEQPAHAVLAGCLYWRWHDLNGLADRGLSDTITRRINGGLNGLEDRRRRKAFVRSLWQ